MSITDEGQYGDKQIRFLEAVWGEGFLSPGGTTEIDLVLEGQDCRDLTILDIGCGCGGAVFHLIRAHGAAHATGIDVEPLVINRAQELAENYGLDAQTSLKLSSPARCPSMISLST